MIAVLFLASATSFFPWLSFDRSPAFQESVSIEVGTLPEDDVLLYEFKRTVRSERGDEIAWTDTKRCPQARDILTAVTQLERPAVSVPFFYDDDLVVTADGVGYHLRAYAQYKDSGLGDIEFTSNVGTPLARWVDKSLSTLEHCWSTIRVKK